jgi:hypothetical protein
MGAAPGLNPALVSSSATLAVYDWTTPSTMTAGAGGPVSNGSTIALVPNVKSPGTLDLGQTVAGDRPTYTNGAIHDGVSDFLRVPFTANTGPANATLVYVVKTSDTQFMLGGTDDAGQFYAAAEDGNASTASWAGSAAYYANSSLISAGLATRNEVRDAWATGSAVVARVQAAAFQSPTISDIRNSYSGAGFFINGNCMLIAILNASDGNYSTAIALAEAEAARVISALGL